MSFIRSRRVRWAIGGALILALLAIVLGSLFTGLIAVAERSVPAGAGAGFWAVLLLRAALIWGVAALPFGAILGSFAALIWRERDS